MAAIQPETDSVDWNGASLDALVGVLSGRRFVVLTGAGCSTESGIPDYRGNGRPTTHSPIQHDAFVRRPEVRQRYWARATVGWTRFSQARPNPAHGALAEMESAGFLRGIITQNVDRLHHAAGSLRVVELHGALAEVRCLECGAREDRGALQSRLLAANPGWLDRVGVVAPDGDADLSGSQIAGFRIPGCLGCGGALMPDVVFFGGRVSDAKVAAAWALLEEAEVLMVVGSSLAVYSGWRFVRGAAERGMPVAIVNIGKTRADEISQVRIGAPAGALLPRLAAHLQCRPPCDPEGAARSSSRLLMSGGGS